MSDERTNGGGAGGGTGGGAGRGAGGSGDDGIRVLAAEYALGLLDPAEVSAVEDRLAIDPVFRAEASIWIEHFAKLAEDEVSPVIPPTRTKRRIMKGAFGEDQTGWLTGLGIVPAVLGALAAALVLYFAVNNNLLITQEPVPVLATTIDTTTPDGSTIPIAAALLDTGDIAVVAAPDNAVLPGRVLELWLIVGDNAPVSLGLLSSAEPQILVVPRGVTVPAAGATLAISDEPPGGSPTGAPTGTVLGAGQLAPV